MGGDLEGAGATGSPRASGGSRRLSSSKDQPRARVGGSSSSYGLSLLGSQPRVTDPG